MGTGAAGSILILSLVLLGVVRITPGPWAWRPPPRVARKRSCGRVRFSASAAAGRAVAATATGGGGGDDDDDGPPPWDAVIVGSGAGGLTCAAALAQMGQRRERGC